MRICSSISCGVMLLLIALGGSRAAHADARAEVLAAYQAAMASSSYRMVIEINNKRGPIRSQMDVQLPNRFHMKTDEVEFIVVPEGTWINAGGRWMGVPVDMSKQMQGFRIEDIEQAATNIPTVEKAGSEDIDGCSSTLYRYAATSNVAGRKSDDDYELAVCDATGKPVRLRTTPKSKGDSVIIRYDFDTPISIVAPK